MSCSNPRRRTPVTRSGTDSDGEVVHKSTMALQKAATFHVPSSSASTSPSGFVPPRLPRSQTHMDDVIDANRRRIALTLIDIDEALSNTGGSSTLSSGLKSMSLRDTSLPIPRGILDLPVVDPAMAKEQSERRVLRPRSSRRNKHNVSDSGLGTSITSTKEKDANAGSQNGVKSASAITRSAASSATMLPGLSSKAVNRIHEHTLRPLLEKPSLKDFESIVLDIPRRIRSKTIICLRDVEKTLLFMAPVSQLHSDLGVWGEAYRALCRKEKSKSAALYLDFCFTSIRCIQATVEYLNDRDEQVRAGDRPYTNGYFIDLKEQIYQYGRELAAARENTDKEDRVALDQYVPRPDAVNYSTNPPPSLDEIRLYGGVAENGRPAELIRVKKDGTAISLATGLPVDLEEAPAKLKRSLSEQREDEEEIMRSMARRKKNASPEELAPKKCREPGCDKEFKRPCDLTKHEKTHSRPWKCPNPTCKYHEFGWPTEKEMDRHINDKHSDAPAMYECIFTPCPYKSKRESNCKQHMEKAHGWTYVRTKTNKKPNSKSSGSVQPTPPLGNVSTPSTTPAYSVPTPPQDAALQTMRGDFPLYPADADWFASNGIQSDSMDAMDMDLELNLEHTSPTSATSYDQYPPFQNGSTFILNDEDLYAAPVQIPAPLQTPLHTPEQLYQKMMPPHFPTYHAPQQPAVEQTTAQPHFSPNGQEHVMFYTPNSMQDVDDGFGDESLGGGDADFQLFPSTLGKQDMSPLFGEVPSANLGFSQTSQQDVFHQYDWTQMPQMEFQNYQE
ncbi:hypothetical protein S7711_05353 [Stachybotrys chartarum IBT 7711]|uniref:C2H2-type domain-containing protein n=1 Tax=Stachybotrys chartarum (strain CBS 109288 / IBT 7711) TaxID=1280523 RepID=A0A084B973_STACB|nr:hypothetical protein S7711_05353 [Stachybotrys chartarum IBT 7711]KFA49145.1 hypothetical protein S40293_06155 [Stachybotrys chartarum IBT 40293]